MALEIRAPFAGWSTPLAEIPDEVFARAMLGEGAAIDPISQELCAPCDGEVISIAAALHAIALRAPGGAEILVHVGIDTVALGGQGFTVLARKGDRVRAGDVLLRFDLEQVALKARSLITPVIVTNADRFRIVRTHVDRRLSAGDVLFEIEEQSAAGLTPGNVAGTPVVSEALVVAHAHGIHARPAGLMARVAKTLPYRLEVRARGRSANPQSAVALMSLGVRGGDEIVIVGFEAAAAQGVAEIARVVRELEPAAAHAAPVAARAPASPAVLPASTEPGCVRGVIANRGFVLGPAAKFEIDEIEVRESGAGVESERAALERALAAVRTRIGERARTSAPALRDILQAHLELLDDPQLQEATRGAIRRGKSAGFAWRASIADGVASLNATGDARLMERAGDFADLERQVLRELSGAREQRTVIAPGSILVARDLTPSQLIDIDAARLAGIALMAGGPTSHVAILAGTLGIPMLVSLGPALRDAADGTWLILDADSGILNVTPGDAAVAAARARLEQSRARSARELGAALRGQPPRQWRAHRSLRESRR